MLLENEMLYDLTDVYKEHAPLTLLGDIYALFPDSLECCKVKDRIMALGSSGTMGGFTICWIRQDWLKRLGLEAPTTLDELREVARAFVEKDPDGNGLDDTIGIGVAESDSIFGKRAQYELQPIAGAFNAYPGFWHLNDDGAAVYGTVTKEFRKALGYIAEMYKDNLLYKEFAVGDVGEDLISGKCGIMFGWWSSALFDLRQNRSLDDSADWTAYLCPLDENGKFNTTDNEPATRYLVVSAECEHPEAVLKVLDAEYKFHWGINLDEIWKERLLEYETMGVLYSTMPICLTLERSEIVPERHNGFKQYLTTGSMEGLSSSVQSYIQSYISYLDGATDLTGWAWIKGMYEAGGLMMQDNVNANRPVYTGVTETMKDVWTTLKTMEEETIVKVIMGEATLEDYDAFVESWYALGGQAITDEVNAYLASR
jgi:putative aldouronate transport system substrate-binding protein